MTEYDVTLLETETIPRVDRVVLEQRFRVVGPLGEFSVPNKTKVRDIIEREMGVDLPGSIVIDEYEMSAGMDDSAASLCLVTHYMSVAKPDTSSLPSWMETVPAPSYNPFHEYGGDTEVYGTSPVETITKNEMREALTGKSKHIEFELTGTAMTGWEPNKEKTECPHCEESFEEGKGVEGDDGTELCSLSCVNEYYR